MGRPPKTKPPLSLEQIERARAIIGDWARVIQTLERLDENGRDLRLGADAGGELANSFEGEHRLNEWRRDELLAAVLNATRGRKGIWEVVRETAVNVGIEDVVNNVLRLREDASTSPRVQALREHDRERVVEGIQVLQALLGVEPTPEPRLRVQLKKLMDAPPEPDPDRWGGPRSAACSIVAEFIAWHPRSVERMLKSRRKSHGDDGIT